MREGQRGFCFVRMRENDEIVLTTFGRSSGFCIDPMEKKPLYHFLPGTSVLSFGTAGCNLACRFCQNWGISKSREADTLSEHAAPNEIADLAARWGCRSIAFTYNEPAIFHEYAVETAAACRERGIKTVAVTAGYVCDEPRRQFYQFMDAANVDLKSFTHDFYRKIVGGNLETVLDTLRYIKHETEVWLEITNLLIPGYNDSVDEVRSMVGWIVQELGPDVPIHFTAFRPDWKMRDVHPTPKSTLVRARDIAIQHGIRYAYTGNIVDTPGATTYCHHCGEVMIERVGYRLGLWNLTDGFTCASCRTPCAGIFKVRPSSRRAAAEPRRVSPRLRSDSGSTSVRQRS
jgi:pyruvate formate lyase activating enzyme